MTLTLKLSSEAGPQQCSCLTCIHIPFFFTYTILQIIEIMNWTVTWTDINIMFLPLLDCVHYICSGPSPIRSDSWWAGHGELNLLELYELGMRRAALAYRRADRHPSFRAWIISTGGRVTGLQRSDSRESLVEERCCRGGSCPRRRSAELLVPVPSRRSSAPLPTLLSRADVRILLQLISAHPCPSLAQWWGRFHFSLRTSFLPHLSIFLPR